MRNVLNYLRSLRHIVGGAQPASLVVLTAVCGNDLEHRFGVAAVADCSLIVTGALLAAGLKTGGDEAGW
jgi:hypothetical protein